MPCRSDYEDPTPMEVEHSKVLALLEEIKTGKLPNYFGNGSYRHAYGNTTKTVLDKVTEKLCLIIKRRLKKGFSIKGYSLELQIWWRDHHQKADKIRERKESESKENESLKVRALAKLTDKERKALGF